ncbi:MAG TPA: universal stress protein [Burkholderiales bacterium]|nr:universal stress protein [Burkholderiales bacterium]
MYERILIPTDGSTLAAKGVREGVRLARLLRARVTGAYVAPPFVPGLYTEGAIYNASAFARAEYRRLTEKVAHKALRAIEHAARDAGVPCRTRIVYNAQPWRGILKAARSARCDAIVMASHGRGAVGGLLIGSETSRVLAHSRLPVLVVR